MSQTPIDVVQEWTFGEATDVPDQPLTMSRALRGVLHEGKPQGSLRWLFFQPNLDRAEIFWLGSLLLTQADRVVFFPSARISGFRMTHNTSIRPGQGFDVDHVTLEKDRGSWHLTGTNRRRRSAGPGTLPLGGAGVLWFGMNSAGPEILPPLKQQNRLRFLVPASDAERRKALLSQVRRGAVDQIVSLNTQAFSMRPPWSVQFNFFAGPAGFSPTDDELVQFRLTPEEAHQGPVHFETFVRSHRVALSESTEVLVATFPIPGEAQDRWSFTSFA